DALRLATEVFVAGEQQLAQRRRDGALVAPVGELLDEEGHPLAAFEDRARALRACFRADEARELGAHLNRIEAVEQHPRDPAIPFELCEDAPQRMPPADVVAAIA